jgi:zinc ribbon protein
MSGMNFMDSLRKGLDRAGFEADKLMRYNRVRAEAGRLNIQAREQIQALGERALALHKAGTLRDSELEALARDITDLQSRVKQKEDEANAIQTEDWVEPPDAAPATPTPYPGAPVHSAPPAPSYAPSYPPAPPPAPSSYTPPAPSSYTPAPPASSSNYPARPLTHLDDQGTRRVPAPGQTDYCQNCGAPLRPHAAFCAQCGVRV